MAEPLNPTLYRMLQTRFGEDGVEVKGEGAAIAWYVRRSAWRQRGNTRLERVVDSPGEEYKVNCPFCTDTRQRLQINHRWGVWDPETQTYNLWLAQCFNEQCLSDADNQRWLYEWLFTPLGQRRRMQISVRPGRPEPTDEEVLRSAKPPGEVINLRDLAERNPHHPATLYLQTRFFDPKKLGALFGVGYCLESRWRLARDRIYIPVYMRNDLVGWQCRYIGDDVDGCSFKEAGVPKYWSMPGMKKRNLLYNYDWAVQHQTVLLVEGPADVWGAGPHAVGILGKKLSRQQTRLLTSALRNNAAESVTVVVLLDPEQDEREKAKRKPHHIEQAAQDLRRSLAGHGYVLPVYLPEETDPGSSDREYLRELVRYHARQAGVPVDFGPPPGRRKKRSLT